MFSCCFCRMWCPKLRVCPLCRRLPPPMVLPTWATSRTTCRYVLLYQSTIVACIKPACLRSDFLHYFIKTIWDVTFCCRIWWALFQDKTPTCLPSSPTCLVSSLCTSRSADLWINMSLCGIAYSHTNFIPFWQRIYFNAS